jgi:ParB family chromosome partitioning protein
MQPTEAVPEPEQKLPAYSAALIETLTQHKTAAIAVELSQHPTIALAALVHALVLSEFGLDLQLYRSTSFVQVSTRDAYLQGASEAPAFVVLEQQKREWLEKLATAKDLWTWCLEQEQQTTLELLAYCVARTVNGVRAKSDAENSGSRLEHADMVARALAFDMGKWFTPTAENFFSKISKVRIAEALVEAGKPASPETMKLKKPELAAFAESEINATEWLPQPIRISPAE